MKNERVLYFEGAGMSYETSDNINNHRIRTAFTNNKGIKIYLEVSRWEISKFNVKYIEGSKIGELYTAFDHCFKITGNHDDENKNSLLYLFDKARVLYKRDNLVGVINKALDCSFVDIVVLDWITSDYLVHKGRYQGYNLCDDYIRDLESEAQHKKVYDYFYQFEKNELKKQWPNFSYNATSKKTATVLIHYNKYNDEFNINIFDYGFDYKPYKATV